MTALAKQTTQLEQWTSDFGEEYTTRNDRPQPERIAAWRMIMRNLPADRVLEVGCNVGWNLSYLWAVGDYSLHGLEPQPYAVQEARSSRPNACIVQGSAFDIPFKDDYFDMAFTCGVLIHIHKDELNAALDEIYRVSRRYILYVEYDCPSEVAIHYRGNENLLWKRDHRAIWLERYPDLEPLRSGFLSKADGFDDCSWCVFEKPQGK